MRHRREACLAMIRIKELKNKLKKAIFGYFFVFIAFVSLLTGGISLSSSVYAEPVENESTSEVVEAEDAVSNDESITSDSDSVSNQSSTDFVNTDASDANCKSSLGAIGWFVCPVTGKIAEAIDFLYGLIEDFLAINPIKAEDGTPIYEIWKYCRGITNIVFIIFLLIVIYSQITGLGISNYGIKKALPKLIIAAILVNLSFVICSLAVDLSNIIGSGIRDVFATIAESAVASNAALTPTETKISVAELFTSIAGGAAITIGGIALAWQPGIMWMLIPTALGAIVAIVTGLITIALRQAVVALLVMISPLAVVANILPNTEDLFKKWKDLLKKMLVFYPMFSLLFGASNLAGFALITSAESMFGVLIGIAVQIFPLFFAWNLMRMSGTMLGDINTRLRGLAARPLAANQSWATSRTQLSRQRALLSNRSYMPSVALMKIVNGRRFNREMEMKENEELLKNKNLAGYARSHYRRDGTTLSRAGERAYQNQAENMKYQYEILRDKNNFNAGFGHTTTDPILAARLKKLDVENINASDKLKMEQARGEFIDFQNAKGFYERIEAAQSAHTDDVHGYEIDPNTGQRVRKRDHKFANLSDTERIEAMARYNTMRQIADNDDAITQHISAVAAHGYASEIKAVDSKTYVYNSMIPSSKHLEYRISELTNGRNAAENIDVILPGLRVINQRGDTDVVREQLENIMTRDANHAGLKLGSHASQVIASFLMFEVKDSDPWLRRFGKYINLETARMYNKDDPRTVETVTYDEYVKGYHYEPDPNNPGQQKKMMAKKGMRELMEGTSLDNIERTAFDSYDQSLRDAYTTVDANGNKQLDVGEYLKKKEEVENAIGAAFISGSLKYLSGSEQLVGAVKSRAGYVSKQDKDTGKSYIVPIWEDPSTMAKYGMTGHEEEIRKFYQRRTLQYLLDQSPNQLLGLRSDYKEPLMRHLYDNYVEDDADDWLDEERVERDRYVEQMNAAQGEFNNLPDGARKDQARARIAQLRQKMVGANFRRLLNSKGKLEQIYGSRRSGAANNAKDWVRDWLNLDDPREIQRAIDRNRQARNNRDNDVEHGGNNDNYRPIGQYTEADVQNFRNEVDRVLNRTMGASVEEVYDELRACMDQEYGGVAQQAIDEFEQYFANHRDTVTRNSLADKAVELISRDILRQDLPQND